MKKATSSVHNLDADKPPFGSRFLTDDNDVWSQNAWDHVPPPTDQAEVIAKSLSRQRSAPVPDDDKQKYNEKPARHWDNFYKMNNANFFRDRKWLHNEFPILTELTQEFAGPATIVEIGCGAGNSVFPLLSSNRNPDLRLHAYDYASHAVKLVQHDPLYLAPPIGKISASVWDLTSPEGIPADLTPGTVDVVILVFVFSALHPAEWSRAISNVYKMLKPGGHVLFRDYGRYDMAQLRFKGGRLLDENFYIRGDKTRVYFFELDEIALLFTGSKTDPKQQIDQTETTEYDVQDLEEAPTSQPPPSNDQNVYSSLVAQTNAISLISSSVGPASESHSPSPSLPLSPPLPSPLAPTPTPTPSTDTRTTTPGSQPASTGAPPFEPDLPGDIDRGTTRLQSHTEVSPAADINTVLEPTELHHARTQAFASTSASDASSKSTTTKEGEAVSSDLGGSTLTSNPTTTPAPGDEAKGSLSTAPPPSARPPQASEIHPILFDPSFQTPPDCAAAHPLFSIEQLGVDRRLIVNRKRQIKMYRVWMQGRFKKL